MNVDFQFLKQIWNFGRQVIIIVPLFHVTICVIFLLFYQFGFGHGISEFYSPADIFSVSYRDVGPTYLVGIVAIIIGLFFGLRSAKGAGGSSGGNENRPSVLGHAFLIISAALMVIGGAIYQILFWKLVGEVAFGGAFFVIFGLVIAWSAISDMRDNQKSLWRVLIILAITPFATAAMLGATQGELDSVNSYDDFSDRPTCKGNRIIRSIGANYLAVNNAD